MKIEAKNFLFKEMRIKGKVSLKVREAKKGTILLEGLEVIEWLREFIAGACSKGKQINWLGFSTLEGRRYVVECKRNRMGFFIALTEFFGKGRRQLVCLPAGKQSQGWGEVD